MEPIAFRLRPSLRRCCWYALAAVPVIAAGIVWLPAAHGPREDPVGLAASIGLVVTAPLIALLRWRVWLSERGLHRRFIGCSTLWPWWDFEAGLVRWSEDGGLIHTTWRWWNPLRTIHVPSIEEAGREAISLAVERRTPTPRAIETPEELTFFAERKRILLDNRGLQVEDRSGVATYLWSEVESVDVIRTSTPAKVNRIEISLAGTIVRASTVKGRLATAWHAWRKCIDAAVVVEFLRRRAPDERFHVSWAGQPLANRALAERLAADAQRNLREFQWCFGFLGVAFLGMIIWIACDKREPIVLMQLVPVFPTVVWFWWAVRGHASRWREHLQGERWRSEPPPTFEL